MKPQPFRSGTSGTTVDTGTTDRRSQTEMRIRRTATWARHDSFVQYVLPDAYACAYANGSYTGHFGLRSSGTSLVGHGSRRENLPALRKRRREDRTRCPRLSCAHVLF